MTFLYSCLLSDRSLSETVAVDLWVGEQVSLSGALSVGSDWVHTCMDQSTSGLKRKHEYLALTIGGRISHLIQEKHPVVCMENGNCCHLLYLPSMKWATPLHSTPLHSTLPIGKMNSQAISVGASAYKHVYKCCTMGGKSLLRIWPNSDLQASAWLQFHPLSWALKILLMFLSHAH